MKTGNLHGTLKNGCQKHFNEASNDFQRKFRFFDQNSIEIVEQSFFSYFLGSSADFSAPGESNGHKCQAIGLKLLRKIHGDSKISTAPSKIVFKRYQATFEEILDFFFLQNLLENAEKCFRSHCLGGQVLSFIPREESSMGMNNRHLGSKCFKNYFLCNFK